MPYHGRTPDRYDAQIEGSVSQVGRIVRASVKVAFGQGPGYRDLDLSPEVAEQIGQRLIDGAERARLWKRLVEEDGMTQTEAEDVLRKLASVQEERQ